MDERLKRILTTKLDALMRRRWEGLQARISEINSKMIKSGTVVSSAHFQLVETECVSELRQGIADLWSSTREVLQAFGALPTAALVEEVRQDLEYRLRNYRARLSSLVENTPGHQLMTSQARENLFEIAEEAIKENAADVDLFARKAESELHPNIFLSYAAADSEIALFLKREIERRIVGPEVFCSSDPTDLPPGAKWSPSIQSALEAAQILILIATPTALQRPWVWFECGTFWFKEDQPIIPLCLGEVRRGKLPAPLSELQALNGDEPKELETLLNFISERTKLRIENANDLEEVSTRFQDLTSRSGRRASEETGWLGVEWNRRFLAYDGPYEGLQRIEDVSFEPSMQSALERAGYQVVMLRRETVSSRGGGFRIVQLTDKKSWRRIISNGDVALAARPAEAARAEVGINNIPVVERDFDPFDT